MAPSPFVIDTHDLGRRPGSMRELTLSPATGEPMGSDVIAVPSGATIELDIRLEAVVEGVLVTGTAAATATGECVRCLRAVELGVEVDLTELFAYSSGRHHHPNRGHGGSGEPEEDDESDPLPELDGDLLNLEGPLTDAIVLALPFQPLCREDCAGLCSMCGVRLDDAEPGHAHEDLDPRWAALAALSEAPEAAPAEGEPEAQA